MAPSKQWMQLVNRLDEAYLNGVKKFLDYAFRRTGETDEIPCPCIKCYNTNLETRQTVDTHLKVFGIVQNYTFWYHHGEVLGEPQSESEDEDDNKVEECERDDEIRAILTDLYPNFDRGTTYIGRDDMVEEEQNIQADLVEEEPNVEAKKFYGLLRDFETPLYQNSKSSKLSTLIKLLHLKSIGRWSNESFTMLLKLLKDELLPDGANLPGSYYEARKVIRDIGLSYQKIDACTNDCMLYWKEDKCLDSCKVCGASRWKMDKHSGETRNKNGKKVASKTLRYFPLKPRLQRLFMSAKTASEMTWHKDKRVDDGIMRHPADSMAWKSFDALHPSFAAEPREQLNQTSEQLPPSTHQEFHHTKKKNSLIPEKELKKNDTQFPPSAVQVTQHTQTVETSSGTTGKEKRVRGRNKCKQVASLEVGEKLQLTFYQNRTVGETGKSFSRHLGIIVRDRNMCPLGVSSWDDIPEEKLNHMWAAIEDKFESDDMDIHRDHIFKWMRHLWNRWRGYLHATYVRGKTIQEALRNMPKGVDKKQWEWLVKEHFPAEKYQAKSIRNAANRAKLKMPHHTGSKPIRQIIYEKGGKEGNPPDLATVFFETRKKNEKLVEPEAIEKHAQIQEVMQSEPSLSTIEIVEKCFGPQNRSHVFGFGGGVKAKDMKDCTPSKAEILSELRSTQAENQFLKNRLSTMENDVNELKQLKDLLKDRLSNVQPATPHIQEE